MTIHEKILKLQNEIKRASEKRCAAFGGRVRGLREKAGMSQETLARYTGVSRIQITNIENGNSGASLPTLIKLCEGLGVTPNDLLNYKETKQACQ